MDHATLDLIFDVVVALVSGLVGLSVWLVKRLISSYLDRLSYFEAMAKSHDAQIRSLEHRVSKSRLGT